MTFLEIAVNLPQVSGAFHYHLPSELEGQVNEGHLVEVPFGQQRVQGVVLRAVEQPEVAETRPVLALVDSEPALTPAQITLAKELAETTLSPLAACVNLMIPAGLSQMADTVYELRSGGGGEQGSRGAGEEGSRGAGEQGSRGAEEVGTVQRRLLELLERRGALRGRQIDRHFSNVEWRPAAQRLARRGLISTRPVLPPPTIHPKTVRTAQLACAPEKALQELPNLGKANSAALARRQAMLRYLLREAGAVNVTWLYAESSGNLADLQVLAERELVTLGESEVWRDPLENLDPLLTEIPTLTQDQEMVWGEVRTALGQVATAQTIPPLLLHGVTGSGKTEIYLRAVAETLLMGKQAIVLVPEIALTPQTVRRFVARFPGQVGLNHSGLSAGERYDTWRRARAGLLSVMVGPRSALFTPFSNLGLIVVDECHDDSYYEQENVPHYHAREAAIAYARSSGAVCLLGSATPDLASRYRAERGEWRYLGLPARILAHRQAVQAQLARLRAASNAPSGTVTDWPEQPLPENLQSAIQNRKSRYHPLERDVQSRDLPPVQIVDMRSELQAENRSIFSRDLQNALAEVLEHQQQAILFLNRRGAATYVFCRDCGHVLKCPRCDIPLTFHVHGQTHASEPALSRSVAPSPQLPSSPAPQLQCHHCNYTRQMPKTCPECKSAHIRQYGAGTERVEAEVQTLFPQTRTLRWDYETTRQKGAHEVILSHFANHRADVLIGTQMLAKGLDLPLVTLVGVVLADVGLNMPDYRAAERTFHILTQVAGRAGRSPLGGQVILQTFQPGHYVIQAAARHDYAGFYQQELEYRRKLGYPPFTQLARLEIRHAKAEQAESAAQKMAAQLRDWIVKEERRATHLIGPAPCFFSRVNNLYRWQIILRGPDPASLLRGRALGEWRIEVNPVSLL